MQMMVNGNWKTRKPAHFMAILTESFRCKFYPNFGRITSTPLRASAQLDTFPCYCSFL